MLDRVSDKLHRLIRRARPSFLFTELNTAYRCIEKDCESILDVGSGKGEPMKFINGNKRLYAIAVDTFEPYLHECKGLGIYNDFVLCDVRCLPFKKKSFDIVLCLALIEHLEKEEGDNLLHYMEGIAKKQVIITTPVGKYQQGALDDNPNQKHRYIWDPAEFEKRGYKVRGVGIRGVMGEGALFSRLSKVIGPFRWIPWLMAGPLVYFLPKLAGTQICWKHIKS